MRACIDNITNLIYECIKTKNRKKIKLTEYKHNTSNMRHLYYDTDNCFLIIIIIIMIIIIIIIIIMIMIIIIIIIGDFYGAHSKVRSALQYVQLKWL